MESIKLLAIDMDGTTLNSNHVMSQITIDAINMAKKEGIIVVPSSGRSLTGMPEDMKKIGFDYAVTKNGAIVYDVKKNLEIAHEYIKEDSLIKISEKLMTYKCMLTLSYGLDFNLIYCPYPQKYKERYNHFKEKGAIFVDDLVSYIKEHHCKIDKISCVCLENQTVDNILLLQKDFLDLNIMNSGYPFVEVNSRMCSKGFALKALVNYLGLKKENVAAVGDSDNDTIMLSYANYSFAMGNGSDFLKTIADEIAPTNDENGVAYAIEKILERNHSLQ